MTGIGLGGAFVSGMGLGLAGIAIIASVSIFCWIAGLTRASVAGLAIALALVGAWREGSEPESTPGIDETHEVSVRGTVASFPVDSIDGQRFDINAVSGPVNARFCVTGDIGRTVEKGSRIEVKGMVTPVDDLPDGLRGALNARECDASLQASAIVTLSEPTRVQSAINAIRSRIANVFQRAAPGDAGALMTGLVTGDDSSLSFPARSAFLATGTTHITAVSGSNFALLTLIAVAASGGSGTRRRIPWLAATTTVIWCYAILVGLPPSALRAALMASLALLAVRFGRRPDFASLLIVCAAVQLAIRPSDLHSLSFQLSFAATLALVLVFSGRNFGARQLPATVILTAIAAYLATVPILAYRLGEIAPATIPTNILISPFTMIGFSLAAAASAIGIVSMTAGAASAVPAGLVSALIIWIVETMSDWFPGRSSVGATSTGTIVFLSLGCWSIILAMSSDARIAMARCWQWSGTCGVPMRLAVLGVPFVALTVYGLGTLSR
jgi:competence protein ComEC